MTTVKLVHAADLHIDSPMRGLERYEGAPLDRLRGATRRALENLVELCLEEEAQLLLLAGDLFDGDWRDYATGLFFAKQMSRLREAGIRVVFVRGNHDAQSQIRKFLQLGDHVRELSARRPETVIYDDLGVAVHGQSYAKAAEDRDLAATYPDALPDLVNIGLLHTSATGREGHLPYAPCKVETMVGRGYDYWALGHVHAHEVLSRDPWIVFSGNTQGRHVREAGAKGAMLVTVRDGVISSVEQRELDVARWQVCEIDVSDLSSGYDVVERVGQRLEQERAAGGDRLLALRLRLLGRTAAHGTLVDQAEAWGSRLRAAANDVGDLWIEKIQLATAPQLDLPGLLERDDAIGQIAQALEALEQPSSNLDDLIGALADLRAKLPRELRDKGEGGLRLDEPAAVRALLADVKHLLLERLLGGGQGG